MNGMWKSVGAAGLGLVLLAGCGAGDNPPAKSKTARTKTAQPAGLPTVSIGNATAEDVSLEAQLPQQGTPEWLVLEMTRLRVAPLPGAEETNPADEAAAVARLKAATRQRNLAIIRLAEEAIAETFGQPQKEQVFTAAVHHLTEARLQLALLGETSQIDLLAENARVLYDHDPQSKASAEAAFGLVRHAEAVARHHAQRDPQTLEDFARKARLYATTFPQQEARSVAMLDAAAWSCELHGLPSEAIACYSLIQTQYPENAHAELAAGALRRLHLNGRTLQLAGQTFDGGRVDLDSFRGNVVLVAFWAAANPQFRQDLPVLTGLADKYKGAGFAAIGVNVDQDEPSVARFLEANKLTWPTVFHIDPARRGWNSPAVRYYGVRNVPTYWLVDRNGVVVETDVDPARLEARLQPLLGDATARK